MVAAIILGIAAVLAGPVAKNMKLRQFKKRLPLMKAFSDLDLEALKPFRVVERQDLEPAMVDSLGTKDYIHWVLEDTSVNEDDPMRVVTLFVTYYSGGVNLVPHTPDACFLGAGYEPSQAHENKSVSIESLQREVPIRVLTFAKTAIRGRSKVSVAYNFHCNGEFVETRTAVRLRVNDPLRTYAYFSKVEVSFPRATREQTIEGAAKILDRILPLLSRDHWPDYDQAERHANESESG